MSSIHAAVWLTLHTVNCQSRGIGNENARQRFMIRKDMFVGQSRLGLDQVKHDLLVPGCDLQHQLSRLVQVLTRLLDQRAQIFHAIHPAA